jgi:hypothetical protein
VCSISSFFIQDFKNAFKMRPVTEFALFTRSVESETESEGILGGVGVSKNVPTPTLNSIQNRFHQVLSHSMMFLPLPSAVIQYMKPA